MGVTGSGEPAKRTTSAGHPPGTAAAAHARQRTTFEALDGDFEARHALFPGYGRLFAVTDGTHERLQFGAQRLGMADREMAHRIAAIRLEAEALSDLPSQQVAHDVFVACRDGDVARFERREPIGVDVGEHT